MVTRGHRLPAPTHALGVTHVTSARAWTLVIAFLVSIWLPPLLALLSPAREPILRAVKTIGRDVAAEWTEQKDPLDRIMSANRVLLAGFAALERAIEQESVLGHRTRPIVQELLLFGGAGNEKTYAGRAGWLFYRPEIDYLTAKSLARVPETPEQSIAQFAADLADRGIRLVLLPTPGKPLIHPEMFSSQAAKLEEPPQRADWRAFRSRLEEACREALASRGHDNSSMPILVDPTKLLWRQKAEGPQFLRADSHWRPAAMEAVAEQVAVTVANEIGAGSIQYDKRAESILARGDTSAMLQLGKRSAWNREEEVTISRVVGQNGAPWRPDFGSPILLLGDSFSNIYSRDSLGWGEGAGFPEHLSAKLGVAVDAITRNDDGATATRRILAEQLAQGNDRLAGKKLVLWQFAMRELVSGRWEFTPLVDGEKPPGSFLSLKPGERRTIQGTIRAMGPVPRPAETPYKDYLTAFQIADIADQNSVEALVYITTMENHRLTPAAKLEPGDEVALVLTSWTDAEPKYGAMNRGELDDENLLLEDPNFAELAQ